MTLEELINENLRWAKIRIKRDVDGKEHLTKVDKITVIYGVQWTGFKIYGSVLERDEEIYILSDRKTIIICEIDFDFGFLD